MNELLLSVDIKSWEETSISHGSIMDRKVSQNVITLYKRIFKRDNYTCYYCGFQSDEYQEIHHLNDDHNNYNENNLVTICPLCHQSHHLNSAFVNKGAELIYLPELTQQELNHLCRAMFIAYFYKDKVKQNDKNFISNSINMLWQSSLYTRKAKLDEYLGEGASDLGTFSQILLDIKTQDLKKYMHRYEFTKDIKLLHKPKRFQLQTQYWMENQYKNLQLHKWLKLATELVIDSGSNEIKEMNDAPLIDLDSVYTNINLDR